MMMEVCVSVYEKIDKECEWVRSRTFMTEDCDISGKDFDVVFREEGNDIRVIVDKREYHLFCFVMVIFKIGGLNDVYSGLYRLDRNKLCDCICEKIREVYDAYSSKGI